MDSYKQLEKLLNDIYADNHGLSIYIEDMLSHPDGAYCVSGWNDDFKKLKHYRWIRNKIVHDLDCTEENMCTVNDVQWLDDFYLRVLSRRDPIALYRKYKNRKLDFKNEALHINNSLDFSNSDNRGYIDNSKSFKTKDGKGCVSFCLSIIFATLLIVMALFLIKEFA